MLPKKEGHEWCDGCEAFHPLEQMEEKCEKMDDGIHCVCWYECEPCCACGADAAKVAA